MSTYRRLAVVLGSAAISLTGTSAAAQAVDTSEWRCEFCPFETGWADVEAGAATVSDDSASIGSASGYDEEGIYPVIAGTGSYTGAAHRIDWTLEDLGLDSRYAQLEGMSAGKLDYRLAYRALPWRRYITSETVFLESGGDLVLPSGWVPASTTQGMSALAASLSPRDIGSDRELFEIGAGYRLLDRLSLSADYRHQQQEGLRVRGGSYFTNGTLLPMPFDHTTDEVELGVRYANDRASFGLSWYLSDFDNDSAGFSWESPFTTAPGAETAMLARAPDNRFQQLSLAGRYAFPGAKTVVSASAAAGRIEQDELLLAYTANPNLATGPLPRATLDAEIDTRNFAFSVTSSVLDKARLELSWRHDERDNATPVDTWTRVIADSFSSGDPETNVPYSYERSILDVAADYEVFDTLTASAGYEFRTVDRDFQEVAEQDETTGFGRIRWRPSDAMEVDLEAGAAKREVDRYDEAVARSFGQNPLLRKYNLAYRYREFGEAVVTVAPAGIPVSLGLSALYADDSYTKSEIGLLSGEEAMLAADIAWSASKNVFLFLHASLDRIESIQAGSAALAAPDWSAATDDEFRSAGAGLRIRRIRDRIDLEFEYRRADGTTGITVTEYGNSPSRFPDLRTEFSDLRLEADYRRSEAVDWSFFLRYQRFETRDWALSGVDPATIPLVLTLGADPYDEDVLIAGLSLGYRFGGK